jgi:PilZ domain
MGEPRIAEPRIGEQRAEPRSTVMVPVEASWQDESGASHTILGILDNMSRSGVSIRVSEPIPVGSRLQILAPGDEFSGIVVHCHLYRQEFLLGLRRLTAARFPSK